MYVPGANIKMGIPDSDIYSCLYVAYMAIAPYSVLEIPNMHA
jgi:hypothetical protein